MIPILRPVPLRVLERALDRAVTADPTLAPARTALLGPLRILEVAAREAEAVLRGDSDAMGRLRLVLAASAGRAFAIQEFIEPGAAAQGHAANEVEEDEDARHPLPHRGGGRCIPGIIHAGALVVVALAAGRVGKRQRQPEVFVNAVLAVAMSAAPAEAVTRALRAGLTESELALALGGLAHPGSGDAGIRATLATLLDDCEAHRRECLKYIFRRVRSQAKRALWEPVVSSAVESVALRRDKLSLVVGPSHDHEVGEPHLDLQSDLEVVLRGRDGLTHTKATVIRHEKDDDVVQVEAVLPAGALGGALGLYGASTFQAANEAWSRIRETWERENKRNACLAQEAVPLDYLPSDLEPPTEPPPRSAAEWGARIVSLDLFQDRDPMVEGVATTVEATIQPSDITTTATLTVHGHPEPLPFSIEDGAATASIPKEWVLSPLIGEVQLSDGHGDRVLDERRFEEKLEPPAQPPLPGKPGPIVIKPAFSKHGVLVRANAAGKMADLPPPIFLTDADLYFPSLPEAPDDPVTTDLLERLERIAARTVGLERQPWVVVLPKGPAKWHRLSTSSTASSLVVATEDALDGFEIPPPEDKPEPTQRLRIVGKIVGDDVAITEPVREERAASSGDAPFLTDIVATTLDDEGHAVTNRRIGVQTQVRSGAFAMLLPISDRVRRVELRRQSELLALEVDVGPRVTTVPLGEERTGFELKARAAIAARFGSGGAGSLALLKSNGRPSIRLFDVALQQTTVQSLVVHWEYAHDRGLRGRLEIELGDGKGAVWSRCATVDASAGQARIDVGPLDARLTHVRIVASDGWNAVTDELPLPKSGGRVPGAILRKTPEGALWIDAPSGSSVRWTLKARDGSSRTVDDFAFQPTKAERGTLRVVVDNGRDTEHFEREID